LDDKSAAFVPTGDAEAAVEVLTNLLWEPDRMADLSKNARQRALEFDWPIVAAKTVDIYKKIL
jgi:glycosyltransferase involved in cell wall biosynthesis